MMSLCPAAPEKESERVANEVDMMRRRYLACLEASQKHFRNWQGHLIILCSEALPSIVHDNVAGLPVAER